jgi:hypothetical protein
MLLLLVLLLRVRKGLCRQVCSDACSIQQTCFGNTGVESEAGGERGKRVRRGGGKEEIEER